MITSWGGVKVRLTASYIKQEIEMTGGPWLSTSEIDMTPRRWRSHMHL